MTSRRFGLWALRGGALGLSIGVVGLLMFRASAGCSNQGGITPETSGASTQAASGAAARAPASTDDEMFIPAPKSEGGTGRRLLGPDAGRGEPEGFFPGSKMGPVRPLPKPEQSPAQQQNQAPSR